MISTGMAGDIKVQSSVSPIIVCGDHRDDRTFHGVGYRKSPAPRGDFSLDWVPAILLGLAFYLVGSIPTVYILVYLTKGVDIRQVGTGNAGALNAFHQTGVVGGLAVLAIGAGKGALAVLAIDRAGVPDWIYISVRHCLWPGTIGRCC